MDRLVASLKRLPGIGEKSATRLAFHLLGAPDAHIAELADAIARVKKERDESVTEKALARIDEACAGTENLMEPILEAVEAYATLGEIAGRWTAAWGRFRESF